MSLDVRLHFRKLSKLMEAEADVANGTGHAVTTGRLRELIVHKFLRPNLPKRMDIRSGVIIDGYGNRSRQQDCIIVDTDHPIISVGSDTDALVIAESVLATMEIKSFLSTAELRTTLESSAITKGLFRNGEHIYKKGGVEVKVPKPHPILTYIFAFDGSNLETLHAEVARFAFEKNDGGIAPEATCVLNKGTLLRASLMPNIKLAERSVILPAIKGVDFSYLPLAKDGLFSFYCRLRDDVIPLRIINYDTDPYYAQVGLE